MYFAAGGANKAKVHGAGESLLSPGITYELSRVVGIMTMLIIFLSIAEIQELTNYYDKHVFYKITYLIVECLTSLILNLFKVKTCTACRK